MLPVPVPGALRSVPGSEESHPGGGSRKGSKTDGQSFEAWVQTLWRRMDRDESGHITRAKLDCEEFHNTICSALTPESFHGSGGATYARVQMNMLEAIKFCLKKADINHDNVLSFDEFRSLMFALRQPHLAQHSAHLVFALFDLDCSGAVDKFEFHEMLRFFLGRNPTEAEYRREWAKLAPEGQDVVSQHQYVRWLRKSKNPAFNQYAPDDGPAAAASSGRSLLESGGNPRPQWNKRFNAGPTTQHANEAKPAGQREYFSKAQSLPELRRFYSTYRGFKKHQDAFDAPPPERATSALWPRTLSSEGGTPLLLPQRHSPAGTMIDHRTGQVRTWDDYWTTPLYLKRRYRPGDRPLSPQATFPKLPEPSGAGDRAVARVPASILRRLSGKSLARDTTLVAEPW